MKKLLSITGFLIYLLLSVVHPYEQQAEALQRENPTLDNGPEIVSRPAVLFPVEAPEESPINELNRIPGPEAEEETAEDGLSFCECTGPYFNIQYGMLESDQPAIPIQKSRKLIFPFHSFL